MTNIKFNPWVGEYYHLGIQGYDHEGKIIFGTDKCPECGSYIIGGVRGRKYCMNSECPTRQKAEKKTKEKK